MTRKHYYIMVMQNDINFTNFTVNRSFFPDFMFWEGGGVKKHSLIFSIKGARNTLIPSIQTVKIDCVLMLYYGKLYY